jgi:hypothetical protein
MSTIACCTCGDEFQPKPDKPGLRDQCPECGRAEELDRAVAPLIAGQGSHVSGFTPVADHTPARCEALAAEIKEFSILLAGLDARLTGIKKRFSVQKTKIRERLQSKRRELKQLQSRKTGARVPGLEL